MSQKHYSPLRYPGGKNCIFNFMVRFMQDNKLMGMSYAEPFAGGAGLALHLLLEEYVDRIFINDLDRAVYTFWKVILEQTDDFCQWLEQVPVTMDTRQWAKATFQQYQTTSNSGNASNSEALDPAQELELAKATFFLNRVNVSGVLKGGVIGGLNQTGKYKIDARFNREDLLQKIRDIAEYRDRIIVSNLDAMDFIRQINERDERIFLYLDPPYVKKGAELYMNYFKHSDHEALCKAVKTLKQPWLVSYDNTELIRELYKSKRMQRVLYQLSQCASNRSGDEVIVCKKTMKTTEALKSLREPQLI